MAKLKNVKIVATKSELLQLIHDVMSVIVENKEISIDISGYKIVVKNES